MWVAGNPRIDLNKDCSCWIVGVHKCQNRCCHFCTVVCFHSNKTPPVPQFFCLWDCFLFFLYNTCTISFADSGGQTKCIFARNILWEISVPSFISETFAMPQRLVHLEVWGTTRWSRPVWERSGSHLHLKSFVAGAVLIAAAIPWTNRPGFVTAFLETFLHCFCCCHQHCWNYRSWHTTK